jgi:diguanylate cyclase (GGDEF)-like protein/PAS domain S-box-containing protein
MSAAEQPDLAEEPEDDTTPTSPDVPALVRLMPDLVLTFDADGVITWVGALPEGYGWREDDLVGHSIFDLYEPTNDMVRAELFAEVLRSRGPFLRPLELTVPVFSGEIRRFEFTLTNALGDPSVNAIIAVGRDVSERGSDEAAVKRAEAWASALLQGATDLIFAIDRSGTFVFAAPGVSSVLGFVPEDLIGRTVAEFVHPEDRNASAYLYSGDGALAGGSRRPILRFRHADGTWRRLHVMRTVTGANTAKSVIFSCRDLSDENSVAELLTEQTLLLERIARGAPVAETLKGVEQVALRRLRDGCIVVGYFDPDEDFVSVGPMVDPSLLHVLDRVGITRLPSSRRSVDHETGFRRNDGWDSVLRAASGGLYATVWVNDLMSSGGSLTGRVSFLREHDRDLTGDELDVLGVVTDLASIAVERYDLHARLAHGALHDELTGLPNRRFLLGRMKSLFQSDHASVGLLFVDLDRFKLINDSLGHDVGDQLLQDLAERFRRTVREVDLVARVGGDEFVVVCPDLDDVDAVAAVAHRITEALQSPVDLPGGRVVVSASVGVVHVTGTGDATAVLQDADLAMYEAKQQGRNRVSIFHQGLRNRAVARLEVENALRDAISSDEMELHYQPVIRLTDSRMIGVEALLRWRRPGVGLVQPGLFVPVATDTGLILPLGRWVIEQAVAAAARWPELEVAANLSAKQLADADLVDFVAEVLERNGVEPHRLCMEVTEADLITDTDLVVVQLSRFKELGVRLAIDDFGTGFATLDYLRRFSAADILKLDASFIAGVADPSSHDLAIVSAAMVLADNLRFETIAEGVETRAQREVLANLGCHSAQGYLYSPAVPGPVIDDLVAGGLDTAFLNLAE